MHYNINSSDALCDHHTPVSRLARAGTEMSHTGARFSSANNWFCAGGLDWATRGMGRGRRLVEFSFW